MFELRAAAGWLAPAIFLAAACAAPACAAEPDASDWSKGHTSSARLIAAGGLAGGAYTAGVEIRLDPGSHTYWSNPGDAGVPPVFSFAGSDNLRSLTIHFPAPKRFAEAGGDVFGYRDQVIFPLEALPVNAAKPVTLVLDLQYAACDKICIPAQAKAGLRLSPAAPAGPQAARIAAFAALAPKPSGSPGAPTFRLEPQVDGKVWGVAITPAPDAGADLFAEFSDGWFFETKRAATGFTLTMVQHPQDAGPGPVEVKLTYTGENGAWESIQRLDARPATP